MHIIRISKRRPKESTINQEQLGEKSGSGAKHILLLKECRHPVSP